MEHRRLIGLVRVWVHYDNSDEEIERIGRVVRRVVRE